MSEIKLWSRNVCGRNRDCLAQDHGGQQRCSQGEVRQDAACSMEAEQGRSIDLRGEDYGEASATPPYAGCAVTYTTVPHVAAT